MQIKVKNNEIQLTANGKEILAHSKEKPMIYVGVGQEDVDMYRLTEECVRVTEEFIKEHPDEWLWFQHRWMTKMDQIIDYDKKVAARERAHEKQ